MRVIAILFVFISFISETFAAELKYPAFQISDTLKVNAWSVVRDFDVQFSIKSQTLTKTKKHIVITVLNENGKKHAWKYFSYGKDVSISHVEVKMYNELGVQVNKWGRKDLKDVSYDPYGTTYTDTRLLLAKPITNNYPYTVEYEIEYTQNNTYSAPTWSPVQYSNQSIENSSFQLIFPENIDLNLNEQNLDEYKIAIESGATFKKWTLTNLNALKDEPFSPYDEELFPMVQASVNNFTYSGYKGSFESWKRLGQFYSEVYQGLDQLPDNRIQEITALTKSLDSDKDKVKELYNYMQVHTRYISIQVGIGGIQPIPSDEVSENGYGDCKALSNYMLAMLKVAGIKSHIAFVQAGEFEYYFNPDFVSHHGNHAILCVPLEADTVWLECTSQTMPFNYLGNFTDNRYVLLMTENGGVIAKTPEYTQFQNRIARNGVIEVQESGNCTATLKSVYSGLEYDEMHSIAIEDSEEQEKKLYDNYDFPNYKITDFELNTIETPDVILNENLDLELPSYAAKSGTRLFLPLNLASKWTYVPKEITHREFDINKKYEASYSDTLKYLLPDTYTLEVLPKGSAISSTYGNYNSSVIQEGNTLLYIRYFEINKGTFPASEYDSYITFLKEVKKNDGCMAVLKKN